MTNVKYLSVKKIAEIDGKTIYDLEQEETYGFFSRKRIVIRRLYHYSGIGEYICDLSTGLSVPDCVNIAWFIQAKELEAKLERELCK